LRDKDSEAAQDVAYRLRAAGQQKRGNIAFTSKQSVMTKFISPKQSAMSPFVAHVFDIAPSDTKTEGRSQYKRRISFRPIFAMVGGFSVIDTDLVSFSPCH
jgi:hypothetical protein